MFKFNFSTAEIAKPPQKIDYNENLERHIFQGPKKSSLRHKMTQPSVGRGGTVYNIRNN